VSKNQLYGTKAAALCKQEILLSSCREIPVFVWLVRLSSSFAYLDIGIYYKVAGSNRLSDSSNKTAANELQI
jgi:hypothetical protein